MNFAETGVRFPLDELLCTNHQILVEILHITFSHNAMNFEWWQVCFFEHANNTIYSPCDHVTTKRGEAAHVKSTLHQVEKMLSMKVFSTPVLNNLNILSGCPLCTCVPYDDESLWHNLSHYLTVSLAANDPSTSSGDTAGHRCDTGCTFNV